jgi:hypothetical protein
MIKRILLVLILLSMACASLAGEISRTTASPAETAASVLEKTAAPETPSATPTPSLSPTLSEDARRQEEYALYDVLLERCCICAGVQRIVIQDRTSVSYLHLEEERMRDYLKDSFPEAGAELFADFFSRNEASVSLVRNFDVEVPVILISKEEITKFFGAGGDGWNGFHQAYPGAQGILQLSRVGFNAAVNQALIYAGNQSDDLAGAGYVYLMEKRDGIWSMENSIMVWIS